MSHTLRIYNNPRLKKAQRFNLDDGGIHLGAGIPYTRRSYICMGRCRMCRDHNRDTRLIRKRTKEQFRFELKSELRREPKSGLKSDTNASKNESQLEQSF